MGRVLTLRSAAWLFGLIPVGLEEVASGLSFPVYLTAPAGDAARLFIVEKGGAIRIVNHNGDQPRAPAGAPTSAGA